MTATRPFCSGSRPDTTRYPSSRQSTAVSEVSLRRPIERGDYLAGFVRVVNFNEAARDTAVTIVADGRPVDRSPLQVPAVGHSEATFRVWR